MPHTYDRIQDLWKPLLVAAIPALLILKQPDLGTSLVIGAILTVQLFFGLPKLGDFLIYAMAVFTAGAAAVGTNAILKPFQKARLFVFLNPHADPQGAGYNLNQSKIAVGNGEWFGRGLHHGTQTQLNFVPEHSRDFIFTVLAEEFGFLGAAALVVLYGGATLWRHSHDDRRRATVSVFCLRPGSLRCCSFTFWSISG